MSALLVDIFGELLPTQAQSQVQKTQVQTQTQAQASPLVAVSSPSSLPPPNEYSSPAETQAPVPTSAQGKASATTNNPNPTGSDSPSFSDGSSQAAQTKISASALATSMASGRTDAPVSKSTGSNTENLFTSSAPSNVQSLAHTAFATPVSSSNIPSISRTSNLASIETAAGIGGGYPPTSNNNFRDASKPPVAAIVATSVVGMILVVGMIFLIFRYYKPMRRKHEAWRERKSIENTCPVSIDGFLDLNKSKMTEQSQQFAISPFTVCKIDATSPRTLPGQQTASRENTQTAELRNTDLRSEKRHSWSVRHSPSQTPQRPLSRGAVYTVFPPAWHYNRDLPLPPLPR